MKIQWKIFLLNFVNWYQMMYKNKNRFIQFELWKTCTVGCKFCCNKGQKPIDENKSLDFIIKALDENEIYSYNEIGFIGGEFFNNEISSPKIKEKFYKLFEICKYKNFKKIYVATSLIFDIQVYLIPFLEYLKQLEILDKLILCTSFDVKYRFSSLDKKELWKKNVLFLNKNYPDIRLHTEIILTEWFLQAVLKNDFNVLQFQKAFNTSVDYIEPSSGLYYKDKQECEKACPGFFPLKATFIKFLKKAIKDGFINLDTFLSMELRSNTLYFLENGNRRKVENRRESDGRCEISDKTKKYEIGFIDSEKSMREVSQEIFNIYRGI